MDSICITRVCISSIVNKDVPATFFRCDLEAFTEAAQILPKFGALSGMKCHLMPSVIAAENNFS